MKVRTEQVQLAEALHWLSAVAASRVTKPALAGIRVEAVDGFLRLQATDSETAGEVELPAAIDEPGVLLVSASLFDTVVSRLPDSTVTLADDGTGLSVEGGRVSARVPTLPLGDFPQLPEVTGTAQATIPSTALESISKRVAGVAGGDSKAAALLSVKVILDAGRLVATATDEYRVHVLDLDVKVEGTATALIPPRAFGLASRFEGPAVLKLDDARAEFIGPDRRLTTTLLNGGWPHPDLFFSRNTAEPVVFDREELSACLRRCAAITATGKNVPLRLDAADGVLELSASSPSGSQITDSLPTEGSFRTHCNPDYLLAAIEALGSPTVALRIDGTVPIVVSNPDGGAFRAAVMPMNVKEK